MFKLETSCEHTCIFELESVEFTLVSDGLSEFTVFSDFEVLSTLTLLLEFVTSLFELLSLIACSDSVSFTMLLLTFEFSIDLSSFEIICVVLGTFCISWFDVLIDEFNVVVVLSVVADTAAILNNSISSVVKRRTSFLFTFVISPPFCLLIKNVINYRILSFRYIF